MTRFAKVVLFCLAVTWSFATNADVAIPPLSARVTDMTDTLTPKQKTTLEQNLAAFESKKGAQIAVLIVPTTAPEEIEQYSLRVVEQWKLGRKKVDDGALLIIAKKDRVMRIEVGYGLEGALNDAVSKRIISEIITPYFKQGDFYGGINAGINSMMSVVNGEPLPEPARVVGNEHSGLGRYLPAMLIAVLTLGGILRSALGRFPGSIVTGGFIAVVTWLISGAIFGALGAGVIAFLFTLLSAGMAGRGIGGFYGGGRGGSGGGGFSGGGGGFGGGGASGRW